MIKSFFLIFDTKILQLCKLNCFSCPDFFINTTRGNVSRVVNFRCVLCICGLNTHTWRTSHIFFIHLIIHVRSIIPNLLFRCMCIVHLYLCYCNVVNELKDIAVLTNVLFILSINPSAHSSIFSYIDIIQKGIWYQHHVSKWKLGHVSTTSFHNIIHIILLSR